MRYFNLLILITLIVTFASCTGGKQITATLQEGQTAFQSRNYESALKYFEEVIVDYEKNDRSKECPVYFEAALSANELGQTEKAIDYLRKEKYSNQINPLTYIELAALYREKDNLSKEMDELETYESKYPDGRKLAEVQTRLFELYVESQNWEKAENEWNNLSDEVKSSATKLEEYFIVNTALDQDSVCGIIASELLQLDENNTIGLKWTAENYFWQAEKRYASELKAYEANKTNKQYKQLLNALEVVSADFKTSLAYFKKLYLADPDPKYAKYLGDIYNRLDDKGKADYYYKLAGGRD